jgi:hypothetical protein
MNWLALGLLIVVFLFTVHLVRHYASKDTPGYVYFFVFVGWFLAFGIVVLIPLDVYAAISESIDRDQ